MTIVLNKELEKLVQEKVKSGAYASPEAMISTAIARLLESESEFAPGELDDLVKVGTDDLDRGDTFDGKQVFDEIREKSAAFRAGPKS
jgi:Arc/MetJ-type ribon-helix-helix transcriptional regulator